MNSDKIKLIKNNQNMTKQLGIPQIPVCFLWREQVEYESGQQKRWGTTGNSEEDCTQNVQYEKKTFQ